MPPSALASAPPSVSTSVLPSGLAGLDTILKGGLLPGRAYQVRGRPGTGKTILGWHFLAAPGLADTDSGPSLLITFDEPADQLRADAEQFGFGPSTAEILDLSPTSETFFDQGNPDSFYGSSNLSLGPIAEKVTSTVEALDPTRIVVDSMSHFRQFIADTGEERMQTLSFLRYLKEKDATVLLLSEQRAPAEENLNYLSDGIIELERGPSGRTLQVQKQRGRGFRDGTHALVIDETGMSVHPRLEPTDQGTSEVGSIFSTGVPALDELLSGGIENNTVTMISGPSGVGKTTLGLQVLKEAAGRGQPGALLSFEEEEAVLLRRSRQVNIPIQEMIDRGTLSVHQFRPWSFEPGTFAHCVRQLATAETEIVMLDALDGYRECGPPEQIRQQLHRLCRYLVENDVTVLLINETRAITGTFEATEWGISHLADNLLFLRYLEMEGELRKAIGMLKKRAGEFEKTLREFEIGAYGIRVGEPLSQLRGILSGTPEWTERPRGVSGDGQGAGTSLHVSE